MKNVIIYFAILFAFTNSFAHSNEEAKIQETARSLLQNIFNDNVSHVKKSETGLLKDIQNTQAPRATVLSCSDSRVQSVTIDDTPINDLFFIRNIGNQIDTAKGSVKYGVQFLHTPVLLIIGHVDCGAIKAAIGDYKQQPKALRKELYTFDLPENITDKDGVIHNIHNQVDKALLMFASEIKEKKLVVIGTIYDFKNEYKKGYNRLIILNLNGEKNPKTIGASDYLNGIKDLAIGVN